jgi:hypothetical protein
MPCAGAPSEILPLINVWQARPHIADVLKQHLLGGEGGVLLKMCSIERRKGRSGHFCFFWFFSPASVCGCRAVAVSASAPEGFARRQKELLDVSPGCWLSP